MDLLPSVDILRDHLMAHDRAVREIIALDEYIEEISEQTFLTSMGECMNATFQKMIRISIAEGLKRMYKEYRLQKWLKVQEMAQTVRRVLEQEIMPTEQQPVPSNNQIVPVHNNQVVYWQPQNLNQQMPLPNNHPWQPEIFIQQMISPVNRPYPNVISPIQTPDRTDNAIISSRPSIEATPNEFHQFSITNISSSENHLTSRQLFEESSEILSVDCHISSAKSEDRDNTLVLENVVAGTASNGSSVSDQIVTGIIALDNAVENQSVINPMIQQEQLQIHNELLEESDEEMDWDQNDSSYDESEDSLAGVLFAAEHLLPDEHAVRLDVEMGDMGIGHMVFDRVSSTWYTSHCEFYRAD